MSVKKIKIFVGDNPIDLERKVNQFLEEEEQVGISIIGVEYSTNTYGQHCLVYYTKSEKYGWV